MWKIVVLILVLMPFSTAFANHSSQYPLTVKIEQMPPTSKLLQRAGCSMNCYTGELECKSKEAKNLQLAEASDGNTYELQCTTPAGVEGCPIPLGTYPGRKLKNRLQLLIAKEEQPAQKRDFSILSTRKTEGRKTSEKSACDAEGH